jgi:hypothetical protein
VFVIVGVDGMALYNPESKQLAGHIRHKMSDFFPTTGGNRPREIDENGEPIPLEGKEKIVGQFLMLKSTGDIVYIKDDTPKKFLKKKLGIKKADEEEQTEDQALIKGKTSLILFSLKLQKSTKKNSEQNRQFQIFKKRRIQFQYFKGIKTLHEVVTKENESSQIFLLTHSPQYKAYKDCYIFDQELSFSEVIKFDSMNRVEYFRHPLKFQPSNSLS